VLYKFCPQVGCTDAINPFATLIRDGAGNLYGTTYYGGSHTYGAVFKLAPSGTGWTETVLYSFCAQGGTACTDGAQPEAGLIIDGSGNLYGTTLLGGAYGDGTVFKLTPNGSGWTETVIYSFCPGGYPCPDGALPQYAGVIMDQAGHLYGAASNGGDHKEGVVFRLAPSGSGWTESVLYSFCAQGGTACTDGAFPEASPIMDGAGNLYGTTASGGSFGYGTVYKVSPTSNGWTETVLYSFCAQGGSACTDGAFPQGGLTMDSAGNLYGTAGIGGNHKQGAVYRLTPNGSGWTQTVLYSFCAQGGSACTDGEAPRAGLIMDPAGNLYGTTSFGGDHNSGVVFKLAPSGSGWTETVLYSFCAQSSCADGAAPLAPPIMDGAGNLYGTTYFGGNYNCGTNNAGPCGTVFQLSGGGNTLSVSIIGNPGGRVASSPAVINCGSICSANFAPGTRVTLTASPSAAWGLASWGGACSGIGSCTVTMNASTSVSASFTTLFTAAQLPVVTSPSDIPVLPPPIITPVPQ
jgi:uncharacterized repeat protein (TIGR03803 family)